MFLSPTNHFLTTMMVVVSMTYTTTAFVVMPSIMQQHPSTRRSSTTALFYRDAFTNEAGAPTETTEDLTGAKNKKPKTSIWLELSVLEKAVECAESADICPVDDLDNLANELDEYFHTCDIATEELLEHCEYAEQQEWEQILIILRLQAVLKGLTKNMSTSNNKLVKAVKEKRAEKVKNDWFTEYLEHYHL